MDDPAPGRHDTLTGETPRDEATNPQTQNPRTDEGPRG